MKIWNRSIVLAGLLAACAGSAMAQPTVTDDFGTLSTTASDSRVAPLAGATIFWYKVTVPALTGGSGYLDLGTSNGGAALDSEIGLYDSVGTMIANDDDDGAGLYSSLSFGNSTSPRPDGLGGVAFNGRDGLLSGGEYYIAVGVYNIEFGAADWTVTSNGTTVADTNVYLNFAPDGSPTNPSCNAAVFPGTVINDGTGLVDFAVTVTPGTFPDSTAHVVTMDTSSLGDAAPQPVTFIETSPNVFTYQMTVPAGWGASAYPLTANVVETAPDSRASFCNVTVTVNNPPTGQCCTGDGCLLLTALDCAAQGGTYGGDFTTCGACSCLGGTIPNDNIEDAIELSSGSVEIGTTCGATIDTGNALCNGQTISAGGVWYSAVGTGNTMTATLCGGPEYDSRMSVYCNAGGSLTCVGGNDDTCAFLSQVTFCTQESAQYYVLVHGFGTASGEFQISLTDDSTPCTGGVFCIPTGACCTGDGCSIITADSCAGLGGTYNGDGTTCTTDGLNPLVGTATDTPVAIPDSVGGIPGEASSTLTIDAGAGTISNLVVEVGFTHTYVGDLIVTISNGVNSALLSSRQGGGANLGGVYTFVDFAPLDMAQAATAAGGVTLGSSLIKPFESLSVFDGSDFAGTWTLSVSDNAGLDIGTIDSFSIGSGFRTSNCAPACPPCAADFNQDGGVDGGDIEGFFTSWESGDSCGDTNLDGGVDGGDIEAFFLVWEAGGC